MRFYTGKGDSGETDLLGDRVRKDDPRIELIGDIDESTSSIGFARASAADPRMNDWCIEIQRDLYKIMAELAFTDELRPAGYQLDPARTTWLEALTDDVTDEVELAPVFVIPGDSVSGAAFDLARTVCRRTERGAVHQAHLGLISNDEIIRYLNRLSSFLFIAARLEDSHATGGSTKARQ